LLRRPATASEKRSSRPDKRFADEMHQASRHELDAAVILLAPLLDEARPSFGGMLAQYVGSLIGMDGDAAPALDSLVEHACRSLEGTQLFESLHGELIGPVPERADCGDVEYERFVAAASSRTDDPGAVARSWLYAESWVQPVLVLLQRSDVRRALPQRERLMAAAIATEDVLPELAPWLVGLLRILDGEPLIVVHRSTGTGFRVTISGVADNFQLHTLLAARVIPLLPDARRGLFRRRAAALPDPPTPAMVAAADGSGDYAPAGGITGQFNLVDATGAWIWNEGRPDEIPSIAGVRVVVLDPPPYQRAWDSGRAYPLLRATVDAIPLPADEADLWLGRVAAPKQFSPGTAPADALEWTDDMTVPLPTGRSVADVVDLTHALRDQGVSGSELEMAVAREFALSAEDAAVAVDRVFGGATRAATADPANRPDPAKDPIAFESYRRARERADP
jgi:hypothetical protein